MTLLRGIKDDGKKYAISEMPTRIVFYYYKYMTTVYGVSHTIRDIPQY